MSGIPATPKKPRGIVCPACGGRLSIRRTYRACAGLLVRYRQCGCGQRYVTHETIKVHRGAKAAVTPPT